MRLTLKRLKNLIREELAHMDEIRVYQPGEEPLSAARYNPEAVDALQNFGLKINDKLNDLAKGEMSDKRHDELLKIHGKLKQAIGKLAINLKKGVVQMGPEEAMMELRNMVPEAGAFFY